jgi:hypothetical protein
MPESRKTKWHWAAALKLALDSLGGADSAPAESPSFFAIAPMRILEIPPRSSSPPD